MLLFFRVALPDGFAFLQKRGETFLEIGRAANARIFENGTFQIVIHSGSRRRNQEVFGTREAAGACRNQQVCKFVRAFHQALCRNNFRYQAECFCLLRYDDAARKQEISRAFFANLPRQENGNDRRQEADLHFRVSEFCLRHSQREIAQCRDAAPSGKSRAVYRRYQRPRKTPDAAEHFRNPPRIFLIFRRRLFCNAREHVQIHTRAKSFAVARQNRHACMALLDLVERCLKFRHHLSGDGVAFVRSVQRDGRQIPGNFEKERRIHGLTPFQFTSGACAYFARISFVISSALVSRAESMLVSAPAFRSAARTSSVAMFPTRLSPANGQPPSPVSALSNLRQPASYAARIFSSTFSGRL